MDVGIFQLHVTSVTIFLLLLILKTFLLLFNKKKLLQEIQAKTKAADIILGILILFTGFYLLFLPGKPEVYLIIKIVLVFIAIPLGIIGLKREKKSLALLSLFLFIYIYGIAETKSITFKRNTFYVDEHEALGTEGGAEIILDANTSAALQQGQVIYKVLCEECHGIDGKTAISKAAKLSESQLSHEERIDIISKGKGVMEGYDSELSEQEIVLVAAYTETL